MTDGPWSRVPVGEQAGRWISHRVDRTVLAVVHNPTALVRLLDLLPVIEGDHRIQMLFTVPDTSVFSGSAQQMVADAGGLLIPWAQVVKGTNADLAIATSKGPELHQLRVPIVLFPHGIGYNKWEPGAGSREPGAGSREPGAGSREPGAGSREPFGLGSRWLVGPDGRVLPRALVLAHVDERRRLLVHCPQAASAAVVVGDTCLDRLLVSVHDREAHRVGWGLRDGQRLILLSSTWTVQSLFGRHRELPGRLLAALPMDEYRVALSLHPSIWSGHSRRQVLAWMRRAHEAGLLLMTEYEGWRSALLAADLVIGDHGSTTLYAAALGIPTALATFPADAVDPQSPAARLARIAPRLHVDRPLHDQVDRLLDAGPVPFPPELISSAPGAAFGHVQHLLYAILGLPRPRITAAPARLEVAAPEPARRSALLVETAVRGDTVAVQRFPAELDEDPDTGGGDGHLVVSEQHPQRRLAELADLILTEGAGGAPSLDETLRRYPGCLLAAEVADGGCLIRLRTGELLQVTTAADVDPVLFASAVYARLSTRDSATVLPSRLQVSLGGRLHVATLVRRD